MPGRPGLQFSEVNMVILRILLLTIGLSFALIGRASAQRCADVFVNASDASTEIAHLAKLYPDVKLTLDPAYDQKNKSLAVQRDGVITFGLEALNVQREGKRDIFKHEYQHHLENVKIERGEPTLARFSYGNDAQSLQDGYTGYLRFDELEAHLVELRATKDPETAKQLRAYLLGTIATEKKIVDRLFEKIDSMAMIDAMALTKWPYGASVPENHNFDFSLGEKEAMRVVVSIRAFKSKPATRSQMRQALLDTIEQFDQRIEELEKELKIKS